MLSPNGHFRGAEFFGVSLQGSLIAVRKLGFDVLCSFGGSEHYQVSTPPCSVGSHSVLRHSDLLLLLPSGVTGKITGVGHSDNGSQVSVCLNYIQLSYEKV